YDRLLIATGTRARPPPPPPPPAPGGGVVTPPPHAPARGPRGGGGGAPRARARPWPTRAGAALDGVFTIRTRDDAARLRERLAARPKRVLIIGGGFIGSEVASVCRELDLPVTLAER